MKSKYIKIVGLILVLIVLFLPVLVFAQVAGPPGEEGVGITNPISSNTIQEFITKILDIVVQVGIPISIFFIIYSGFLFVTAQGNDSKLQTAKDTFLYTVIGVAILLGAQAISKIVESTVNEVTGDATHLIQNYEEIS